MIPIGTFPVMPNLGILNLFPTHDSSPLRHKGTSNTDIDLDAAVTSSHRIVARELDDTVPMLDTQH
jgi:hypothetical protein